MKQDDVWAAVMADGILSFVVKAEVHSKAVLQKTMDLLHETLKREKLIGTERDVLVSALLLLKERMAKQK